MTQFTLDTFEKPKCPKCQAELPNSIDSYSLTNTVKGYSEVKNIKLFKCVQCGQKTRKETLMSKGVSF